MGEPHAPAQTSLGACAGWQMSAPKIHHVLANRYYVHAPKGDDNGRLLMPMDVYNRAGAGNPQDPRNPPAAFQQQRPELAPGHPRSPALTPSHLPASLPQQLSQWVPPPQQYPPQNHGPQGGYPDFQPPEQFAPRPGYPSQRPQPGQFPQQPHMGPQGGNLVARKPVLAGYETGCCNLLLFGLA